ncbi:MAG: PepSY-associated TM helix domain-containing protein [Bacteroidia bacterium]|nr:PepSY-associated TM helix domain-containing protein [Bacteroidia bacterium]
MGDAQARQRQAKWLRIFRKIHRVTGVGLCLFLLAVGLTGLLLGWKKNSGDWLLPTTRQGTSTDLAAWLPLDSLHTRACAAARDTFGAEFPLDLERIDVRPDKGMVKFVFEADYAGLQLDGATGRVLLVEKRRSDFVENLHDGSFFDKYFHTPHGIIKLIYTTIMGLALVVFTITGCWLWYGPKWMKRSR